VADTGKQRVTVEASVEANHTQDEISALIPNMTVLGADKFHKKEEQIAAIQDPVTRQEEAEKQKSLAQLELDRGSAVQNEAHMAGISAGPE